MCIVCSTALYKPAGVFQTRVPLIARIPDAPRWKAENGSSVRDRLDYYSIRLILKKKKSDFPSRLSLLLSFAFFEKLGSIIRLNLNINFEFRKSIETLSSVFSERNRWIDILCENRFSTNEGFLHDSKSEDFMKIPSRGGGGGNSN